MIFNQQCKTISDSGS